MVRTNSFQALGMALSISLVASSLAVAAPPGGFSAGPTPLFGSPGAYAPSQYSYPASGIYGSTIFNPFGIVPLSSSSAYNVVMPAEWPAIGSADITVRVPGNAQIWVDGNLTKQSGTERQFVTPPVLRAGQTYAYKFRAQWAENGKTITREKLVAVRVTGKYDVDFLKP